MPGLEGHRQLKWAQLKTHTSFDPFNGHRPREVGGRLGYDYDTTLERKIFFHQV